MLLKRKVSIVIPTYNRKEKIVECLKALFIQNYKNFEIIVVSDGSTDGTDELIKRLLRKHKNLKFLKQVNKGPSSARNLGINNSSGDIIGFTDDDCIPDKNWISAAINKFEDEEVLGVMGLTYFNEIPYLEENKKWTGYLTCNMFYRKDFLEKVGKFDESYPFAQREDTDLAWKILKFGKIIRSREIIVNHPDYHGKKSPKIFASDVLLQKKFPKEYLSFAKEGGCSFIKRPSTWKGLLIGIKNYKTKYPFFKIVFIELRRYLNSSRLSSDKI